MTFTATGCNAFVFALPFVPHESARSSRASVIKPTHKAIQRYYQALQTYREYQVKHEGAVETAFQRLLADTAPAHGWTLIPKQKLTVGKKNIYPDGTLKWVSLHKSRIKSK